MIIAIDGPAGSGKSTVSKMIADKYGLTYIDSGAMYRAVALKAMERGVRLDERGKLGEIARDVEITFQMKDGENRTFLDGRDVSVEIRTPEISALTSKIAALLEVREALVALQRQMADNGGVVMDGRDIGTVVFPNADHKFFLDANLEERARRRHLELPTNGRGDVDHEATMKDMAARDEADSNRKESPLKKAEDAIIIDTSRFTPEEVMIEIEKVIGKSS